MTTEVTLDSTPSPSSTSKHKGPQWRALRWALKFASAAQTERADGASLEAPREYHPPDISYSTCFKDLQELRKLLSELEARNRALTSQLESEEGQRSESADGEPAAAVKCADSANNAEESAESAVQPESVRPYQEYLNMFISLFLHSNFLSFLGGVSEDIDEQRIVSTLIKKTCPNIDIFQRTCVCPRYIASWTPDSSNDSLYRGIPVNQLARFCDIAVLRFLSTATEHTSWDSVIWALEYLQNLLDLLHDLLSKPYTYGWYGAPPLRTRKGTTMGRHSITYPQVPFGAPPVVVVGTPPTSPCRTLSTTPSPEPSRGRFHQTPPPFCDPETGQRSPRSPLSHSLAAGRRGRGSFGESEPSSHLGGVARGRVRRISREEHHVVGVPKRPSFEQQHRYPSHSWEGNYATPPSPVHSEAHGDVTLSPSRSRSSPSHASMQSIPEEEDSLTLSIPKLGSPPPSWPISRSKPVAVEVHSSVGVDHCDHPSPSHASLPRSPPSPTVPHLGVIEEVREEGGGDDVHLRPEIRSPSPGLSGVISPGLELRSPSPGQSSLLSSASSCSSLGPDEEVHSKPTAAAAPPTPKNVPKVNVQMELSTLMNCEGRISLLAILHAISKLPQNQEMWRGELGERCFTIIQVCLNLGLRQSAEEEAPPRQTPPPQPQTSGSDKRKQFQSQKNTAFHELSREVEEKPCKVHSDCVVEFSVRALIHCATNLIVGCSNDSSLCKLRSLHLPDQSSSTYITLTRLLKRVFTFSPRCFRQALSEFAKPSGSSLRKLFQFLHIMLQYCVLPVDSHLNTFLIAIVSAVLRETIDRLVQLDITEASIQNSIVSEACSFFQYAHQLFNSEALAKNLRFRHLHMYIHRIALSVILPPPRPRPQDRKKLATAAFIDEGRLQGLPPKSLREKHSPPASGEKEKVEIPVRPPSTKKLIKQATFALFTSGTSSPKHDKPRPRSESLDLQSPLANTDSAADRKGVAQSGKSRRAQLTKQQSVRSDMTASVGVADVGGASGGSLVGGATVSVSNEGKEWRGLRLDLLRSRIQRLIVVMNTSEPGSVPDGGMLASLVDLGGASSVVSRAMVFLECALFVKNLTSDTSCSATVWINQNRDSPHMYNVVHNIRRWGEFIADKLRIVELKERDIMQRLGKIKEGDEPVYIPEEPVFPDDADDSFVVDGDSSATASAPEDKLQTVSYAIKMSACLLLLEITRFLRNTPDHFNPQVTSASAMSTPRVSVSHVDRKISNASMVSSDMEAVSRGASVLSHPPRLGHFGSSLSVEDAEPSLYDHRHGTALSLDDGGGSSSPKKKRVSVYLRVTSTGGASGSVSRKTSVRRQSKLVSGDAQQRSPTFRRPRKSAALHTSFYTGGRSRRPSIVPNATVGSYHPVPPRYRRKSLGAAVLSRGDVRESELTDSFSSSHHHTLSPPLAGGKTASSSFLGSNFGKLKRSAQRAIRRTKRQGQKQLHPEQATSPGSSPGLATRKKIRRPSISGGSTTQSIGGPHPLPPEESRKWFPWLDVVEHIVLTNWTSAETRMKQAQACKALIAALEMVYSSSHEEERSSKEPQKGSKQKQDKLTMSRSVSTIFAQQLTLLEGMPATSAHPVRGRSSQQTLRSVSLPSVRRRTLQKSNAMLRQFSSPATVEQRSSSVLARFSFANMSYAQFTSSFLGATSAGGREGGIEAFLEEESSFPRSYLLAELDKQRREYIKTDCIGLLHSPLSVLIHAAPILHDTTFSTLKAPVWDMLLDSDPELSKTAAAFFLLIGAKETEKTMEVFVKERVTVDERSRWEAIKKFKVLWDSRYHVWPRMEERAQKVFNVNSDTEVKKKEDQQTIGYSLPANLLGNPGSAPPFPPWEPVSVCTSKSCDSNPAKCYRHTHLAEVVHGSDITEKVENFTVSGVSMPQEASSKPTNLFLGIESEDQDGNIEYWEAVETTLFPHSLFPLIRFVVMALSPKHSKRPPTSQSPQHHSSSSLPEEAEPSPLNVTELARQVVWTCMVEDPQLFFRTLLNQFNKLVAEPASKSSHVDQLLAETLQPLHVLLQAFNFLPPIAAYNLFNNFVGVTMRHTDQPSVYSHRIIQSVLTLITLVVPSVQGLDSKVLKGILKKESCYTAIMTTARIRGVERVYLLYGNQYGPQLYRITDDMTFGHLIAEICHTKPPIFEYYLVDKSKGSDIPVMNSLVIQDEYSMPLDGHYPTFELCRVENQMDAKLWNQQLEQLFVFKMSEVMRVLFMMQLLQTGPEVEHGFSYSEYAQPNYRFIHNELVQLNSFPRKALTSILYEAGPGALQRFQLKVSDVMLKTAWVKFVLQLFSSMKPDFDWSNSIILFLNVINGALLLHSEDSTILKYCLASLLMAATKFSSVFKKDGYLMIVPTLIQVYALHIRNKLVTEALKFTWAHFFLLDSYVFYLQVTAATATLVNEEAAYLSRNVTTSFAGLSSGLNNMEDSEAKKLMVRAVYELTACLDIDPPYFPPPDDLGVRSCCLDYLEEEFHGRIKSETWSRLTLQNAANLCISLARWDPSVLRGMQVLVFLDHMMHKFLETFESPSYRRSLANAMEYLIKGCYSITKLQQFKGDLLTNRKSREKSGNQPDTTDELTNQTTVPIHSDDENSPKKRAQPSRKASVANAFHNLKLLVNPNKKELSERVSFVEEDGDGYVRQRKLSAITPGAFPPPPLGKDFKSRRIHDVQQRIVRQSRDALLSLSTQFIMHFNSEDQHKRRTSLASSVGKQERARVCLDHQSISYLVSIAVQLLKQGSVNDVILQMKGLNVFMTQLLPNIEWTEQYFTSFSNILGRLLKLFKYLQRANRAITSWENLSGFLTGISQCVHQYPQLVLGHDQHLTKLKLLMEVMVSMHSGGGAGQLPLQKKVIKNIQRPLLASAPSSFSDAIVGLAVELIVATQSHQLTKFRYCVEDILRHMPHREMKTHEEQLMTKILLPLCIQLGLRSDIEQPSKEDADYIIKLMDARVDILLKFPGQKFSSEQFFRTFKVICLTFGDIFAVQDWHKVAQWVLSLTRRQLVSPTKSTVSKKKVSTTSITSNESRASRQSSISSSTSSTASNKLDNYLSFHESLLGFYETFVMVYRVPVFSLLWPLLRQLEPQLESTLQRVKSDSPAMFDRVNLCVERCQRLERNGYGVPASKSKHQLLRELQEELKIVSQEELTRSLSQVPHRPSLVRSNTSVEGGRPSLRLTKRRLSTPYISPLTMIGEEEANLDVLSATLPRHLEQRPKMLRLRGRAMTTGSALPGIRKTEGDTSPLPGKKASFADEIELKPINRKTNRSPSPRPSPKLRLAEEERADSPVQARSPTKSRPPKLYMLGKMGSSGFYGDNEDDDIPEVEVRPSKVKIQVHEPKEEVKGDLVVPNAGAVSAGSSPIQMKKASANRHQVTVAAEIHVNPEIDERVRNNSNSKVTFSDENCSTEPFLHSPEVRRKRRGFKNARTPSPMRNGRSRKSDEEQTDGESDKLLPRFEEESFDSRGEEPDASRSRNFQKGSLSLDRKNISGIKELNSALNESNSFMYRSLEDATMDYSQF